MNHIKINSSIIRNSVIGFLAMLFVLIYTINQAKAGYWQVPEESSWDNIICEATECGTTSGNKSQTVYCGSEEEGEYCEVIESSKTVYRDCSDAIITPCPSGTPTPTPSPSPSPTSKPNDPPSSPSGNVSATTCSAIAPEKSGANFHIYRKGADAIAKWTPTAGNKANIYYKQINAKDWQYSVRDIDNNGYYVIHYLGSLDITFALQQSAGCAGGPLSPAVVDGATDGWVLFR